MTGREREQILRLLASGDDFRFEAGRRIRFERRGAALRVRCSVAGPRCTISHIDTLDADAGAAS